MASRGLVWITRAEPGATDTAARVAALGRTPLVAPLLVVRPLPAAPNLEGVGALAFTSANAVRAFASLSLERGLPAYAVGAATAQALAEAGFKLAQVSDGGVEALARTMLNGRARLCKGIVLHPSAAEPAGDLVGALRRGGVQARALPVYETVEAAPWPETAARALREGAVDSVLLHSPKAARALGRFTVACGLAPQLALTRVFGLSPACLAPVNTLPFKEHLAADHPAEAALLILV